MSLREVESVRGQRADNTTPTRRLCADKLCQVVFEVVLSSLKMKVVSFGEKFRNLFRDKRCFTKGVGKVTLRDGHVLVDTEHTHVHFTILVRSHSTCRRASARAAVATGPAAACAAATCARPAVATCAAAACLRRIHREGQHWSTQRQVHRPVRPALSP